MIRQRVRKSAPSISLTRVTAKLRALVETLPLLRAWRAHERRVIPGRESPVILIEQGYWRPPIRVINDYLALARKEFAADYRGHYRDRRHADNLQLLFHFFQYVMHVPP